MDFKTTDYGPYSIKNVKTFNGMEGMGGFNLQLYKNSIRLGEVINDDCGGCHIFHIPVNELKALTEHAKTVTGKDFEPEDSFVSKMVDDFLNIKRFKKIAKKQTLFRKKDTEKGSWLTLNKPYNQEMKDYIVKKYNDVEAILNQELENVL